MFRCKINVTTHATSRRRHVYVTNVISCYWQESGSACILLSRLVGKPTMWFPNRSDTNRPVQAQKRARSLKFRIKVEEELYNPTKALISFAAFAYADSWFSHAVALFKCYRVSLDLCLKEVVYVYILSVLDSPILITECPLFD